MLFAAGFNLMQLQYFIVREFSSLLGASELTILIVAAACLTGYSIGYGMSRLLNLRLVKAVAPIMFFTHILIVAFAKVSAGYMIQEGFGMEALSLLLFIASFCTSAFFSILLPKFIEHMEAHSLTSAYSWDLAGAASGVAVMFLLIAQLPRLLWPCYFAMMLILVLFMLRQTGWRLPFAIVGIFSIALLTLHQGVLHRYSTEDYYRTQNYTNPQLLFSENSFYHAIDVIETFYDKEQQRPESRVSFANGVRYFDYDYDGAGELTVGTDLSERTYFLAELPAKYLHKKKGEKIRILIMGAGSMYSVYRVKDHSQNTTLVEIDSLVIDSEKACWAPLNQYHEVDNCEIVIDDAAHYLKTTPEKFDLIINDIPGPYYLGTALMHGREFYELVKSRLHPEGVFAESTQERPQSTTYDQPAMKIFRGMADAFTHYRLVETWGSPRKRESGYIYACEAVDFSSEVLSDLMKEDGRYTGTLVHHPGCDHFSLHKATPLSWTNMETLFSGSTYRLRDRLFSGKARKFLKDDSERNLGK